MHVTSRAVVVPSQRQSLNGFLHLGTDAPVPRAGVLFVHGLSSSQIGYRPRARQIAKTLGVECLTFDLGGHGGGRQAGDLATWRPSDHLADLANAWHFLARQPGVDPTRIGVCGASYGAYLGVLLTAVVPVARLVLRAPGMYDDSAFIAHLRTTLRSRVIEPTAMVRARLAAFSGPVLIVQSEADEMIPAEVCDAYRQDRPDANHVIIRDAGHRLVREEWAQKFITAATDFLRDL